MHILTVDYLIYQFRINNWKITTNFLWNSHSIKFTKHFFCKYHNKLQIFLFCFIQCTLQYIRYSEKVYFFFARSALKFLSNIKLSIDLYVYLRFKLEWRSWRGLNIVRFLLSKRQGKFKQFISNYYLNIDLASWCRRLLIFQTLIIWPVQKPKFDSLV